MPASTPEPLARIVELETAVAFQQHLCEQLNAIVTEHSQQLLTLQRSLHKLSDQIKELQQQPKEAPRDPADDKPPHY